MYPSYYNMNNRYYGGNRLNNRDVKLDISNEEIITLNQAIGLIKLSIDDEQEDATFYNLLISQAPTQKEKDIIGNIRDDEEKHNKILRNLYYNFTGQMVNGNSIKVDSMQSLDYKSNLEKALFGELEAVKKYRKIMGVMPSGSSYTLLMSIMTDELRHADKYNFLLNSISR